MTTIAVPKKEYKELLEKKLRYEYLRFVIEEELFSPPPTKNRKEVIAALKATKHYSHKFLESVSRGLRRSSYFRKP